MAIELGADAIGLVAKMPSGPGPIPDKLINAITQSIPPLVGSFLLTSETSAEKIIEHHKLTRTNTIQIVDMLSKGTYSQIKEALPFIRIVQVIHVIDSYSVDQAIKMQSSWIVAILILKSKNLEEPDEFTTGI
jgi:phosphoribosylanthranilate isomerase